VSFLSKLPKLFHGRKEECYHCSHKAILFSKEGKAIVSKCPYFIMGKALQEKHMLRQDSKTLQLLQQMIVTLQLHTFFSSEQKRCA
jgi:hypothetical protein